MQFYPSFCQVLYLKLQYFTQHPILKYVLTYYEVQSLHSIQNNRCVYSWSRVKICVDNDQENNRYLLQEPNKTTHMEPTCTV